MTIDTDHLRLFPCSPSHLLALIEDQHQFEALIGFQAADGLRGFIVSDDVSPAWLIQLRASTVANPWQHGFAVVHQERRLVIGCAGFKGPPDETGIVEIAYGIVPGLQGCGYATEVAAALVSFALRHESVLLIRAHTLPTANASARVLAKCGFKCLGEVVDPEDGPVWRWEYIPV